MSLVFASAQVMHVTNGALVLEIRHRPQTATYVAATRSLATAMIAAFVAGRLGFQTSLFRRRMRVINKTKTKKILQADFVSFASLPERNTNRLSWPLFTDFHSMRCVAGKPKSEPKALARFAWHYSTHSRVNNLKIQLCK
jgi:hypothetical protein